MNQPTEEQVIEALKSKTGCIIEKDEMYISLSDSKKAIKSLFRKGEVWEPVIGASYLIIDEFGVLRRLDRRYETFPVYLFDVLPDTPEGKQQAERKLQMVKAVFPSGERFRPEMGEEYYIYDNYNEYFYKYSREDTDFFRFNFNIGNVHRTKEEAEKYGELMGGAAEE